jgi:hypothetical protein
MKKVTWFAMLGSVVLWGGTAGAGQADLPKEDRHQGIVISGEIKVDSVYRNNITDFSDDVRYKENGTKMSKAASPTATDMQNDEEGFNNVQVSLGVRAELVNNVVASIELESNQIAGGSGDDANQNAGTRNTVNQNNLVVKQAYVDVLELFDPRLSMRLGQQEFIYGLDRGDGNEFLLSSNSLQHRHQLRNGGNVDNAFNSQNTTSATVTNARSFNDYPVSENRNTFGYRWVWNEEGLYNLELFMAKLEETGLAQDDEDIYGAYLTMPVDTGMSEKPTTITGHLFSVHDKAAATEENTNNLDASGSGSDFWAWGFGAQWWVNDDLEVFGELDIQDGDFNDGVAPGNGNEEDQNADAWYFGARYNVPDMAMALWVEASWWSYSGDDNDADRDQDAYINYGDVDDSIVVEDNSYGMGISNNYEVIRLKLGGRLDSGADGFLPTDVPTTLSAAWHMFSVSEDAISAANSVTGARITEDDLGDELDVKLNYTYSENLSFHLGAGWFFPGGAVEKNILLGGDAAANRTGDDDTVTIVTLGTSVQF